jgi:hypothetical protein
MSSSHLNLERTWHQPPVFAARHAGRCRCVNQEVMACRDEDGDWTCCTCGRPVARSASRPRDVLPDVCPLQLRAA